METNAAAQPRNAEALGLYLDFGRDEWAKLRAATPLTLSDADLEALRGINERASLAEVSAIYLPLSRLLNLRVVSAQNLFHATDSFLGNPAAKVPFVIGIAGSVAVGKSTTARILQTLLGRWPSHPKVDLIPTDGFLYPNRVLQAKGMLDRKGFPESYDVRRLIKTLIALKSGREVDVPVYSHLTYDIVENALRRIDRPDVVIVEGLNVLQTSHQSRPRSQLFVSDFFDFSIYVDADESDIEQWYMQRFMTLRDTAFRERESYFYRYTLLPANEAEAFAHHVWRTINGPNLTKNIAPTKERAHLVLRKAADHSVQRVLLKKL
ncbi:MAG: pantothenate kinase [Candidatus Eremiobacteraeota bacterium]|nr:pantothenate kinase [Candidatus Eremiobacteraeota bacterium]